MDFHHPLIGDLPALTALLLFFIPFSSGLCIMITAHYNPGSFAAESQ